MTITAFWNQHKMKIMLAASILTAGTSPLLLAPSQAHAAAVTVKPTAYINNVQAAYEVVLRDGTTYAAITDLKPLGNYIFGYDNATKQVTIYDGSDKYTLTANSKTMYKNGSAVALSSAPILVNGKALLPLRAIGEAFGAQVQWNQSAREAYIYKTDASAVTGVEYGELTTARNAALRLPRVSHLAQPQLKTKQDLGIEATTDYIFPVKQYSRFFIKENSGLVSYYEVENKTAVLKWQANFGAKAASNPDVYFIKSNLDKEIGKRPSVAGSGLVQFRYSLMLEEIMYSFFNKTTDIGSGTAAPRYTGNLVVPVPEELNLISY
ncbi:copper amine oxidase N-terminal domain-containing protein [Paenibacillus sp. JX-17]|uniref:Copper amine oxidase N-terminal domain-containing protein n=1 Tax=Paenibacillus lacisoli TaxID=3064525 RepID=A0ABT9CHT1_9BACL|nr:copper amine oxidase N-terminal domain-containing protein [Paenibacillus sp. JX-17]MDO7908838.1 copper amine oxidase N-terminal domain-containing protein [Paenibacillus sp. JX-17]